MPKLKFSVYIGDILLADIIPNEFLFTVKLKVIGDIVKMASIESKSFVLKENAIEAVSTLLPIFVDRLVVKRIENGSIISLETVFPYGDPICQ